MKDALFTPQALRRLIVPLVAEQFLAILVGMVDVVMVSSAGEAAVSGVSLVDMINILLINIFAALATGGAVVTSQLLGAKQRDRACRSAAQLVVLAVLLGGGIMAITLLARTQLLRILFGSIAPDVMEACQVYLVLSALSYPFLAVYNASAALFRSMGNARVSMFTSIGMNLMNVAGNAICIYGLHMGVAGVALPTLISRVFAAFVMILLLRNETLTIHLPRKERFRFDGTLVRNILHIGVPNALENGMFQLGRVLVVSIIAGFGTAQIAANGVANGFDSLGTIPGQAINLAMLTVVGRCVGAQDYKQATHYTKKLLQYAYIGAAVINGAILLSLPWTIHLYQVSAEAKELATVLIWIHDGMAMLIWPLAFTLPNALRAANDVKYTMWVAIFSMWTFRLGLGWILGSYLGLGALGIWIAMIIDWVFRMLFFVVRFARGKWKRQEVRV